MEFTIRRTTVDDAPAAALTHARAVAATYTHIMPPEFAEARLAEVDERAAALAEAITRAEADEAAGVEPFRRHWVAVDQAGEIIAVAASGPGIADWERELGFPPPIVPYQLQHLYALPGVHGTGVGAALLEAAIGDRDAHLWILRNNPRAEAFYRKHGFVDEGTEVTCGPMWFHRRMFRMHRRAESDDES
ncbi:GNAT family N-acetyltransferase [Enemella sp. A6]|uniref:GNAT family N-acetyltransferase n=1 Tax=Enemella sp. A6 TaxID=3440152 RepID=UPI003EB6A783